MVVKKREVVKRGGCCRVPLGVSCLSDVYGLRMAMSVSRGHAPTPTLTHPTLTPRADDPELERRTGGADVIVLRFECARYVRNT